MSYMVNGRGRCPHCLEPTRFELAARYEFVQGHHMIGHASDSILLARAKDRSESRSYELLPAACAICGGVVVTARPWDDVFKDDFSAARVILPVGVTRPVPPEVEDEAPHIAEDFREAAAVLGISPKASAALSRRCLQAVLTEKADATQRNLADQIDAVLPKLPSYLGENLDAIRVVGNFAAHPQKETGSGIILDVEPNEAEWTLEVLEDLFDFYYVQPAKAASQRERLNEKLERAGKPRLKATT